MDNQITHKQIDRTERERAVVTTPLGEKKDLWNTELDAKRHLLEIHDTEIVLSPEFKKSRIANNEKELIITMLPAAQLAIDLCPNKEVGKEIARMDLSVINAFPIINFNSPDNHVLNRYTQWEAPTEEMPDDSGFKQWLTRFGQQVKGEKNPPIEYHD